MLGWPKSFRCLCPKTMAGAALACSVAGCSVPSGPTAERPANETFSTSGGSGAVLCPITPPQVPVYQSVSWGSPTICGVTISANDWAVYPDGRFEEWPSNRRGSFAFGNLTQPAAASFTITVLQVEGAGTIWLVAGDGMGGTLGQMQLPGPGTYTIRYPGMRSVIVREEPDIPDWRMGLYRDASFEPDCAKAGDPYPDPIVESAEVRKGMVDALNASGREPFGHEVAGVIYRRPDGSYFTATLPDPTATTCTHAPTPYPAPAHPDGIPVAVFHTHPHDDPEIMPSNSNCPKTSMLQWMNNVVVTFHPLRNGGGSVPDDWDQTRLDLPMYTITIAKNRIFRLEPSLAPNQRSKTPYKWTYFPQEPGRCAPRG